MTQHDLITWVIIGVLIFAACLLIPAVGAAMWHPERDDESL